MNIKQLHLFHWERLSIKNITNISDNVLQVDWCYSYSLLQSKPSQILVTVNTNDYVFHTLPVNTFTAVSLHSVGGTWPPVQEGHAPVEHGSGLLAAMLCFSHGCSSCVATRSLHIACGMEVPKSVHADAAGPLKARQQNSHVGFMTFYRLCDEKDNRDLIGGEEEQHPIEMGCGLWEV